MPRPHTHLFEVTARLTYRNAAPAAVDLIMPVWTPGSYLVREFGRHVQDFAAEDGGGRALPGRRASAGRSLARARRPT